MHYAEPQPDLVCSHRTKGIRVGTDIWQKQRKSGKMLAKSAVMPADAADFMLSQEGKHYCEAS